MIWLHVARAHDPDPVDLTEPNVYLHSRDF